MLTDFVLCIGHTLPPSRPPACPLRGLLTSTLMCCQCKHSVRQSTLKYCIYIYI